MYFVYDEPLGERQTSDQSNVFANKQTVRKTMKFYNDINSSAARLAPVTLTAIISQDYLQFSAAPLAACSRMNCYNTRPTWRLACHGVTISV
jgi:hypothetical protein